MSTLAHRAGAALEVAADALAAVRVLHREGLVELTRPDRALRASRETLRLGPVTAAVRIARRRTPDVVAVVDRRGSTTYRRLDERAAALAHGLLDVAGTPPGSDRTPVVGLLCRDHRGPIEVLAACGYAGARAVLLNTGSAAPQLGAVLEREGVDVVVHDAEFASTVAAATTGRELPRIVADAEQGAGDGVPTVDDLVAAAPAGPPRTPARSGGLVVLTSGTTGVPKGAPRPKVSPVQTAQVLDRLPFPRGATVLMAAPVFHGTGLSQTCLAMSAGCSLVLPGRFDAAQVVSLASETRAEVLVLVPTMLHRILALEPSAHDLAAVRRIYVGGSALPADLCRRTTQLLGPVLHNLYGSTEVGVAAVADPHDLALAPGCVGRPPVAARVRVLGPDRAEVPTGERGVVFVRSALTFTGYSDGTGKEVVDGYVSTGDIGHWDEHGLLHIVGREDDMVVSGGENVAPSRVEDVLATHPGVDEVAVVGIPHEEFGQVLRAVVVPRGDARPDVEELRSLARHQLARHEVPREVWLVDELPRHTTGKVLRRVLAAAGDPAELLRKG